MLFVLIWSIVGRIAEKLNSASVSPPKPGDAFKGIQRNSVTEAMLPGKYSRKPITQVEMDAVEVRCICKNILLNYNVFIFSLEAPTYDQYSRCVSYEANKSLQMLTVIFLDIYNINYIIYTLLLPNFQETGFSGLFLLNK